jgi:hypothetical protein
VRAEFPVKFEFLWFCPIFSTMEPRKKRISPLSLFDPDRSLFIPSRPAIWDKFSTWVTHWMLYSGPSYAPFYDWSIRYLLNWIDTQARFIRWAQYLHTDSINIFTYSTIASSNFQTGIHAQ